MVKDGRLKLPLHVQFVMGVKNAMPVDREAFEFMVKNYQEAHARCDLVRCWDRPAPSDAEQLVRRIGRTLPHNP